MSSTNGREPAESREGRAWWNRFQALLDDQTDWPTMYTFKFIAPHPELEALKALFGDHPIKVRTSSKGNYVSVTARIKMSSSKEVLEIYSAAYEIEDVIAL